MEIRQTKNGNQVKLALGGRFDFNVHREFKEAYMALLGDESVHAIEVSLAEVDYLDSSALGMLLMLRERALTANKQVSLSNPNKMVSQVLDIANFHKLFTIA
jgi:anti-anti-sigma factor